MTEGLGRAAARGDGGLPWQKNGLGGGGGAA